MNELIKQTIGMLKDKVNQNLSEIRNNELVFRKILIDKDLFDKQSVLKDILDQNKNLLAENFDCINVQLHLIKFMEKYKYSEIVSEVVANTNEFITEEKLDYLQYTISGHLPYNIMHPKFYDDSFFNELMSFYQEKEDYEKCIELINIRQKQNFTQN